jgi:hypothetical protein
MSFMKRIVASGFSESIKFSVYLIQIHIKIEDGTSENRETGKIGKNKQKSIIKW